MNSILLFRGLPTLITAPSKLAAHAQHLNTSAMMVCGEHQHLMTIQNDAFTSVDSAALVVPSYDYRCTPEDTRELAE